MAAPLLNTAARIILNSVTEDAGSPSGAVGTLVSSLVGLAGAGGPANVADADPGAVTGIAITGTNSANGTWWYSLDNGATWNAVGARSTASSLLLAADGATRLYFQPNPNFSGVVADGITFLAWDRSSGTNGGLASTAATGGDTAFSALSDTASIAVGAVNDAPSASVAALPAAQQDTALNLGGKVSIADIDAISQSVRVTLSVGHGTLDIDTSVPGGVGASQVSGDTSGTVVLTGTPAQVNATLAAASGLGYRGEPGYSGSDTLTVQVNDQGNSGSGGAQVANASGTLSVAAASASNTLSVSQTSALKPGGDVDGDGAIDPGDTVVVTVAITNNSATTSATGVTLNQALSGLADSGYNVSPIAVEDSYNVVGNTLLEAGGGGATGPALKVANGVFANDLEFNSDTYVLSKVQGVDFTGAAVSTTNGTVTMRSDGSFSYQPKAGYVGTDSFTYTIRDKGLDGIAGNADDLSTTATVKLTISGKVWYLDGNAAAGGDGTSSKPFNAATAAVSTKFGTGDYVYVQNNVTGNLTLVSTQHLVGTGEALVVDGNTLAAATGARSTLTGDSTAALTLGSGNEVAGITIAGSGGITGSSFGTLTVTNVAINSTSQALSLTSGTFSGTGFVSTSSAGGVNNVVLKTVTGNVNLGAGTLSGATGIGVQVEGGSGNIDYDGSVTHAGNAAAVSVTTRGSGTIDFDGAVSASGGSDGVVLTNNTGTTINFDGGVTINSTSGGFHATATGAAIGTSTVNVTGSANTISSGTTTALRIVDTKIGSNDLNFQSISSNGAANGIYLHNTGTAGGLNVTGDATTVKNTSGGTIANSVAGVEPTDGTGVYLSNTRDVVLEQMSISGNKTDGIYGQNLTNLTLDRLNISGNGDAVKEAGVQIGDAYTSTHGLTGTMTVTNTTVTGSAEDNFRLWNNTGNATLNITSSTFSYNSTIGNDGVLVESVGNSNLYANVTNSTFTGNRGDHFQAVAGISGTSGNVHLTFTGNTLSLGSATGVLGGGITVTGGGGGSGNPLWNGRLDYNISNNNITGSTGTALSVGLSSSDTGAVVNGFVQGNTIGNGAANSGSVQGGGIFVGSSGKGTHTLKVSGNTVQNVYDRAVNVLANDGSSTTNLTLQSNYLSIPNGVDPKNTVYLQAGSTSSNTYGFADNAVIRADVSGNNITASSAGGSYGIYVRPRFSSSIAAEDYTGIAGDRAAFQTYLQSTNGGTTVYVATLTPPATVTTTGAVPEPVTFTTTGPAAAVALPEPAAPAPAPGSEAGAAPPASEPPAEVTAPHVLDSAALGRIVAAAIERWAAAGASAEQLAAMRAVTFSIDNLAGLRVGASDEGAVVIDANAAGYGWFIDPTPAADEEFAATASPTRLQADGRQVPANSIDLLTVVMHELGHQIGLADSYLASTMDNLMSGFMPSGERRLPAAGQADNAPGHGDGGESFAIGALNLGTIAPGQTVVVQTVATAGSQTGQLVTNPSNSSTVSSSFGSYTTNTSVTTVDSLELGGTIFNDLNGSGAKDGADAGIDGVTVQLLVDNGSTPGAYDSGDTVIASTTSANGGAYRFTGLAPGDYIVQVQESNFGSGAPLDQLISLPGNPDPDGTPDVAGDDNGARVTGKGLVSLPVTLGYDSETTADASGKRDINDRLDFGVRNEAPVIGNLSGDTASYAEGASAVLLDSGAIATLADANNTSLQGGFLRVSVSANGVASEDVLGLNTSGTVTLSSGMNPGSVVSVSGTPVGTVIWPGSGGVDLVIGFGNATPAQAATLLGALTYRNSNTVQPSAATRTISVTLDDGLGGVASGITTSVQVLPINSAPAVDLNGAAAGTGATLAWTEGNAATRIAPAATVADGDSADVAGGSLTVAFSASGTAADQLTIINSGTGAGQIGVAGSNVTYGGTVIGTFGGGANGNALTVNFNAAAATPAAVQQLMRDIAYANTSDNPSTSARSISFTLVDGDGTANGGADTGSATATVNVTATNDTPTGGVAISGTPTQGQTLTASNTLADADGMGTVSYQWKADGANIAGATASTLVLGQAQVGKQITVVASFTDGGNSVESATSTATSAVANINDAPTGGVTITGTAAQNQTLTAANTLGDLDGMGTVSYKWQADGVDIAGATGSTLVLGQSHVGKQITVVASYTDSFNHAETATSAATVAVANANDAPTGAVTITGTATQGQTLTASNTLADLDGLGTISYQWKADGVDIAGATASTLVLGQAQVGKAITVVASYTDGGNANESVASSATPAVANVNDAPTGGVSITGTATQGQTLTATSTLADLDGLGAVSYQWKADGANIATGATLALGQGHVGKVITVVASYTDNGGALESATSAATSAVANTNDAPTGSVTVTGTARQGETLTVSNNLADVDGLGAIGYQWKADGVDIAGATGATLVLAQAQVGKQITAVARYTDGFGANEAVSSSATAAVINVNDATTGGVTISGTATQGQTLTASNTLADADGMGTVGYQWKADGAIIAGATGGTLVLGQAQVGKQITVVASFTDGGNTVESATSAATTAVANTNDAPTGAVTITGTLTEYETLTASNTLADADGLGTISYQWRADGADIAGATGSTLVLAQSHVGKQISVVARYADGFGTAESVASAATAPIANFNNPPTGAVTITGTATQGQTLSAAHTLADIDGLGTVAWQWRADGVDIAGAIASTLVLGQAQVGKPISVVARYTDGGNAAESVASSATPAVANVNDAPTGGVSITGTAAQGQTLAATSTLADLDGLGAISYQWKADGANIATGATLVLGQGHVGKVITVVASYTDNGGALESATSAATTAVANTNDTPTGSVTVTGTARQGETLTVSNNLADVDGLGTISYQWKADGADIAGATGTTLVLTQAQVGKQISAVARYTDGFNATETVSSSATAAVVNVNDATTGGVTISGTATQGQTLTASNTLADADGMGTVGYQWKADSADIAGATGNTLVLGQAQVGKQITVVASFTDGGNTVESATSTATTAVANTNDAPTGAVTISGTAAERETLTANSTLADADGLGTISYQWRADGADIAGATGNTLLLAQSHVGKQISVVARYTDGFGALETVASTATPTVANFNNPPTGSVTITGTPAQGQTLSAANTLADIDGLGTVSYQWKADGADIAGVTGSSLVLAQSHVGKAISVVARYTDGGNAAESVASTATAAVANVNDAPTGSLLISGRPAAGQTLTLSNQIADVDGLGTMTYQWRANGADIAGATGTSLSLAAEHIGKTISVVARYTDGGGTAEAVASSATTAVVEANRAPTGSVSITGTPTQGQQLSASHNLADADGLGTIGWQWQANGADIAGATSSTLVLAQDQVGKTITVLARYTDQQGSPEAVASAATAAVANVNDAPTGSLLITGTAALDQTLTVTSNLADPDGLGAISYQWRADGADIAGATGSSLVLTQAQVGKAITVVARYTDTGGFAETASSAATAPVANVNHTPTGSVTITGQAQQGDTLSANANLADANGVGTVRFQWQADGADIAGATGATLVLGQSHVGKLITVVARYTDSGGTAEQLSSGPTAAVANVNDAPQGTVRINGGATEGETLVATHTLSDADGMGAVAWQWRANGVDIAGATGSRLVLGTGEIGKAISVVARYTDGGGTAEQVASAASPLVEALPPPPPPVVVHKEDGVEVAVRTETRADGTVWQKIEVPVVTDARQEQVGNATAADIGLVKNSAGGSLLAAVVPSGMGLSASGAAGTQTGQAGQQALASSVGQYAGLGGNALSGYANNLPQDKALLVQTIVVSTTGTGTPAAPLTLGGSGNNVERALVIDTSTSAGGAQVKLDNVGFAAVVGKASVEAGSGNQHIVADDKAQQIKAGAGNDVVRAGGGNDVLDGGSGNDHIDGGEGVDVVQLSGRGRADYALRFDHGQLVVTARGNGNDGADTLANVEKLRFADAPPDTSPAGSLDRIYASLLGRDADPGGDAWWLGQHQAGLPMHEIAAAILNSSETSSTLGTLGNAQFVDALYQRTLGRPVDEAGRTFWVQQLEQGKLDRADLLLALVDSDEKLASSSRPVELDFNQSDVAALIRMYYASFGRAPDESGINFWIAQSEAGLGLNDIAAAFVSSSEQGGALSDSQFVAELYRDALHREASQSELSAWVDALTHGGTRASVMLAIAQSDEMVKLVGSVTTSLPTF